MTSELLSTNDRLEALEALHQPRCTVCGARQPIPDKHPPPALMWSLADIEKANTESACQDRPRLIRELGELTPAAGRIAEYERHPSRVNLARGLALLEARVAEIEGRFERAREVLNKLEQGE